VIAMGAVFNLGNGYLNGRYLFSLGPELQVSWLSDPRSSRASALHGRVRPQPTFGSCAHRAAADGEAPTRSPTAARTGRELSQLSGGDAGVGRLGSRCWNLGALAFFVWTVATWPLAPSRPTAGTRTLPDYPESRKALLPFVV